MVDNMFAEIQEDLAHRMSTHIDSRCATADEVRLCWLVGCVEDMKKASIEAQEALTKFAFNKNVDYAASALSKLQDVTDMYFPK